MSTAVAESPPTTRLDHPPAPQPKEPSSVTRPPLYDVGDPWENQLYGHHYACVATVSSEEYDSPAKRREAFERRRHAFEDAVDYYGSEGHDVSLYRKYLKQLAQMARGLIPSMV